MLEVDKGEPVYFIEVETREVNILVQRMLFKRGFKWNGGEEDIYSPRGNDCLMIFTPDKKSGKRGNRIVYAAGFQNRFPYSRTLTLTELAQWPEVGNG